jgi:hypothetical protein
LCISVQIAAIYAIAMFTFPICKWCCTSAGCCTCMLFKRVCTVCTVATHRADGYRTILLLRQISWCVSISWCDSFQICCVRPTASGGRGPQCLRHPDCACARWLNPFDIPLPPSPVCRVALVTELFEALVYIVEPNRAMQRSYSSHWPVLVYFINARTAVRYRYDLNLGSAIHCQ